MTMQHPQLWSLNGLASEVGLDRRTLAKRLKGTAPDGQLNGNPAWHLSTVLKVLQRSERPAASSATCRVEPELIDEIERTHEALVAGLIRFLDQSELTI